MELSSTHIVFLLNRLSRRVRWCLMLLIVIAASSASASSIKTLTVHQDVTALGSHLQYWIDAPANAELADVMQLADSEWTDTGKDTPNFGFTDATYWFRVTLSNSHPQGKDYLLEIAYPALDFVDFHVLYSNGELKRFLTGDYRPFDSRPIDRRNFVIPITLKRGETAQLFLRVQTNGALQLPITLSEHDAFYKREQYNVVASGIYFGALMIMCLYNLFIFSAVRDASYIYYTFSIASFVFLQLALHGWGYQIVWYDFSSFNRYALPLSISLNICFTGIFSLSFLRVKDISASMHALFQIFVLSGLICVLITVLGFYNLACQLSTALGIVGCGILLFTGWRLWLKGHVHARYYALAWTSVLLLTILLGLNKFGIIPRNAFTEYSMQVGGILEAVLLSFALADRITSEKKEKLLAQERALRLELDAKEDQMRHRERIMEAESKAKNKFIMVMSHELRTPLNGILGLASILKGDQLDTEQRDHYLDVINSSGLSLLNILQSILDYSRLDSEGIESQFDDTHLHALCSEVIQLFKPMTENKGVKMTLEFSAETPAWVKTDSVRIRQILLSLVGNADKFTERGEIKLTVSRQADWLRFTVSDTGIGISTDKLQSLFRPFHQIDSGSTRRFGGAGMGLSLSKRLVEILGGEIGVSSEPGKGSTFWFTLPFQAAAEAHPEHIVQTNNAVMGNQLDWSRYKALVVEDNAVNRLVVVGMLKKIGLQFDVAEDGLQALNKLTEPTAQFDLVLMDCDMPVMDGYAATRKIREWENDTRRVPLPIIALTAQVAPEHVSNALSAGMSAHLGKPISIEILETSLRRYLTPNARTRSA